MGGKRLEHVLEFKYLDAFWTNQVLLGVYSLSVLGCYMRHCLCMPFLMYDSEKVIWKEARSRIRAVQTDNLRGLLGIRRMDKTLNAWIKL